MQLTILLTAFMCFFGVLRSEATADSTEVPSPRILQPHRSKIRAVPGEKLIIECKADPGLPDDFTHVYWLVNSTFPEVAFTDGRVSETEESASEDGRVIQRSLVLKNVTAEDFKSTFTCVISSLAGLDRRTVTLMPTREKLVWTERGWMELWKMKNFQNMSIMSLSIRSLTVSWKKRMRLTLSQPVSSQDQPVSSQLIGSLQEEKCGCKKNCEVE